MRQKNMNTLPNWVEELSIGEGVDVKSEIVYERLENLLFQKINEEIEEPGSSASQVGQRLGLGPTSIYKLLDGSRGKRLPLKTVLKMFERLGVPMSDVLKAISPELATQIAILYSFNKDLISKLNAICVSEDESAKEKLIREIDYLSSNLKK